MASAQYLAAMETLTNLMVQVGHGSCNGSINDLMLKLFWYRKLFHLVTIVRPKTYWHDNVKQDGFEL